MKRIRSITIALIVGIAGIAGLAGCVTSSTGPGLTPQAAVFQAKSDYDIALKAALLYEALPDCASGAKLCSTHAVKVKIKAAKDVASPSIQAAENFVCPVVPDPTNATVTKRDCTLPIDVKSAPGIIAAAQQAVLALTTLVASLPKQ